MNLPSLIEAMLQPQFYPHHPAQVTLVQSHISYVLLAGTEVYKVKKPVRFSFLDFSTLALRRHFCHEEVRLNRRLAPGTYVDVVGICRDGAGYRLGTEHDAAAAEYAVHMRRLPADRMLDRLLDRDQVTTEMIDTIALRLADFHRAADIGPQVTANGAPAAIQRVLNDNYISAQPFRGVTITAADDDAIQSFSASFLQRHAALFRKRQAEHRIKDCHGDLHTEHICFSNGLVIFDCIEFNSRFRHCDVASEIAFLAMDLDYHDRPALAAHLCARYAAHAGDPDLARLVPFYRCYRAYVRGKVDSLKSAEDEVAPAEREAAQRSARRHFALAYRYSWGYSRCLVAVGGLSGAGKTAVAAALHERTGFVHINSDVVRKRLAGLRPETRARATYDTGLYTPEHSAQTYAAMMAAAGEQLAQGRGVILDATFQRRADRDAARALAGVHGAPFLLVECRCHQDDARRRFQRRARDDRAASDADWTVYGEQRRRYEAVGDDERADCLVLDTTAAATPETAAIEQVLRKRAEAC